MKNRKYFDNFQFNNGQYLSTHNSDAKAVAAYELTYGITLYLYGVDAVGFLMGVNTGKPKFYTAYTLATGEWYITYKAKRIKLSMFTALN